MQNKCDSSSDLSESMKADLESIEKQVKKQKNEKRRREANRRGQQWDNPNLFNAQTKKQNRNSLLNIQKSGGMYSRDKSRSDLVTPTKGSKNGRTNRTPDRQASWSQMPEKTPSVSSWVEPEEGGKNSSCSSNNSALQTKRKEFLNTKQMKSLQGQHQSRQDDQTITDSTTSLGFLKQREMLMSKTG